MNGKFLLKRTWGISRTLQLPFLVTVFLILTAFGASAQSGATVITDKEDYAPRSNAVFTGAGFNAFEDVVLKVKNLSQPCNTIAPDSSYLPWTVKADASGAFVTDWLVCDCPGDSLRLKSVGQTSGAVAYAYFTDAAEFIATITPTSSKASASSISYKITIRNQNTLGTTTSLSSFRIKVPEGYGAPVYISPVAADQDKSWGAGSFNVNTREISFAALGGNNSLSSTQELNFVVVLNNPIVPGNYIWTTSAYSNTNYGGNSFAVNPSAGQPKVSIIPDCTAPSISSQPVSISPALVYGNDAVFTVSAAGTAPLSYTWHEGITSNGTTMWSALSDGAIYSGTATSTLTLSSPGAALTGRQYRAVVSGNCGTPVTSEPVALNVEKATATVTLGDLTFDYTGSAKFATATTDAIGSSTFTITYDGSTEQPINHKPGGYAVVATLLNANFSGSATGTLLINKADQVIIWENPASITYGTALSVTQLNATALGGATLTYTPVEGTVLNAGDHVLTVSAAESDNYKAASEEVTLVVNKATATFTLGDLTHTYDGTAKTIQVATVPEGLTGVTVKNDGQVNVGTYAVTISIDNENYKGSTAADLKIDPRAITVTAHVNQSKVYGTAEPALTYEIADGSLVNPSHLAGALERAVGENVGSYAINKGTLAATSNYALTFVGADFEITRRSVAVTADALSKVYGAADPELTYQATSGTVVNNDTFSGELERAAGENVSTYAVSLGTLSLGNNYNLSLTEGTLFTITPKALIASITARDKVYDGTATATAAGTVEGLVEGDQVEVNVNNASFADKHVGSGKTVTAGVSIMSTNYTLSNNTASTTAGITAKPIAGSFEANNKVYDGTDAATVSSRNLQDVIGQDDVQLTGGTATFADANAGNGKVVTISGAVLSGDDKDNYLLTAVSTALANITRKTASVTPIANSKTYGASDPALEGELEDFLASDKVTASYSRLAGETVVGGPYAITATLSPADVLSNYEITYNTAEFTITKADLVVTADAAEKVYGDANPTFTGTITGIRNNDDISASYTTVAAETSEIGEYDISPLLSGDALTNYTVTSTNGTLTVLKAGLAVVAHDKARIFGVANPVLDGTLTGIKNGDAITAIYNTAADEASNVGTYSITASLVDSNNKLRNYTVSNTSGTLTIIQAPASIAVTGLSKTYNRAEQAATVTTSPEGLAVTVTYDGRSDVPTAAGYYAVVAVLNNSNYSATDGEGTLVIAPKEVTAALANAGKVYDGTQTAGGTTATLDGVISPDDVTATVTGAVYSDANAGDRTITATVSLAGDDKANYTLVSVTPATATISQRAVTVAAIAKSKVYGDSDPALTYVLKMGNLVDGDDFSGELKREVGEDVGSYAINQNSLTAGANYTITYEAANLTITPKAITITANAKSKTYGDLDPALTYAITTGSLVGTDAFTGSLSRQNGENVGTFAIEQGSVALSSNYSLTYNGADLSISPLAVTVTANAKQKYCGQADPALTFVSSPEVGSTLANGVPISFTGALSRVADETVGTYAIGQSTLSNSNYSITYVPANLDILGITVDASASSKPVALGSSASLSATVTAGTVGIGAVPVTFTVTDEIGKPVFSIEATSDGSGVASAVIPSSALPLGVYKVEAVAGSACSSSTAYIPVFDASGSFVTGGGWIDSPVGAMPANPEAIGKANFGFVSKYKKGSSQVDGNTEFQFSAGSINFKSTIHESGSLVIAAGKATYRGTGTVNGASGYKFTITAIDGDWKGATEADKFRIKIVDGRGQTVYDNQIGSAENSGDATKLGINGTGGGSIVIHEAKELTASNGKKLETADQLEGLSSARFDNYPNAFSDRTTIRFAFDTEQHFALEVYDVRGSLIRKVATGKADAGQVYEYELDARHLAEGVYIARLITGSKAQSIKMILKK